MAQTLAEKIIARAAGRASVRPGEIVTCRVDLALMHDSGGPRRIQPILEKLNATVWDPDKIVIITDHYVPGVDADSAAILKLTRQWVTTNGIANFYDMQGICHVVLPERGHLKPGMFVVGGDSHSTTGGAFGCFIFGVGSTEMAGIVATGDTWIKVPETIRIDWSGELVRGVCAKDVALALCAKLGMGGGEYQVLQYTGTAIAAMPMQERMTLCNMAAELGAQAGIIAADDVTAAHIAQVGGEAIDPSQWQGDEDAHYRKTHHFNAAVLSPQVALPHSPANAGSVEAHKGARIDVAYIGACTGAKLVDLQMAAAVLKGRKVADGVRLMVAPASRREMTTAAGDGTLATLLDAGAITLPSGCGACAGYGTGVLAEDEVCVSTTARNFKGRMGAKSAQVFLASPYTVAASAVVGKISDPRELLN